MERQNLDYRTGMGLEDFRTFRFFSSFVWGVLYITYGLESRNLLAKFRDDVRESRQTFEFPPGRV